MVVIGHPNLQMSNSSMNYISILFVHFVYAAPISLNHVIRHDFGAILMNPPVQDFFLWYSDLRTSSPWELQKKLDGGTVGPMLQIVGR